MYYLWMIVWEDVVLPINISFRDDVQIADQWNNNFKKMYSGVKAGKIMASDELRSGNIGA